MAHPEASSMLLIASLVLAMAAAAMPHGQEDSDFLSREKDFLTEPMQRANFDPEDFVFSFPEDNAAEAGLGGSLNTFFVDTAPVLGVLPGNGMGQNLVTVLACGQNQPHNHPRGIETSHILKGKLRFGFLEENGGRYIEANMTQGQSIAIPQGLIHFAQNMECEDAQFLASFPHRDPGTQTTAANFFRLPNAVLRAALGTNDFAAVRDAALANLNLSLDPECVQRCKAMKAGGHGRKAI